MNKKQSKMKSESLQREITDQLLKYYSGQLDPLQEAEVEQWLEGSEEIRLLAKDLRFLFFAADTLDTVRQISVEAAHKKVKKRIQSAPKISFWVVAQRVAAVLLLPFICTTFYFYLREDPVQALELWTNPGMVGRIVLPDETEVWLNTNSVLKYPKQFTGSSREVELNGEAYFVVRKDPAHPFVVHTPFGLKADVLGTEFNMEAYESDNKVTTTLVSGSVRLSYRDIHGKEQQWLMKPNEEVAYQVRSGRITTGHPYIPTQVAWKDGKVLFRNTPLEEALRILSKRFNVEFIVKNASLYNHSFTGPFEGQHLSLVMEHLRLSSGIQYRFMDPLPDEEISSLQKSIVELY